MLFLSQAAALKAFPSIIWPWILLGPEVEQTYMHTSSCPSRVPVHPLYLSRDSRDVTSQKCQLCKKLRAYFKSNHCMCSLLCWHCENSGLSGNTCRQGQSRYIYSSDCVKPVSTHWKTTESFKDRSSCAISSPDKNGKPSYGPRNTTCQAQWKKNTIPIITSQHDITWW